MITKSIPIPEYTNYGKIGDFEVHEIDYDDSSIIAIPDTYDRSSDYGKHKVDVPENMAELKEKMKSFLEPLGLWEEKEFGIWYGVQEG